MKYVLILIAFTLLLFVTGFSKSNNQVIKFSLLDLMDWTLLLF